MSESTVSVSERRIRPIQDAISSGNWKQAAQLCDKWSKKGERSDRFLAVKAFALVNQPDKAQHDRGKQEALDLCKRTPPVTEPEAIYQLQSALSSLSLQEESPKLWERALTAKKDDKDLYMRWLNQAIADNNWRSAQKATMGLRNAFPRERQYEFWNILMCFLIHKQDDFPEKDRMLFGTLAYRMISKAAEAIPKDEEEVSVAKTVTDPEEISLLVQVLNSTGHVHDSLKLLNTGSLSLESRLGKKDPQLVLSLLLESLGASDNRDEALKVCQSLLSQPAYQSDDRIWTLWLKARSISTDQGLQKESKELLDGVCSARPIVRPAYLAALRIQRGDDIDEEAEAQKQEVLAENDDLKKNQDTVQSQRDAQIDQVALLETCKEYCEAFSEKAFCFDDLKDSLRRLDKSHHDDFVQISKQKKGNVAELFTLKVFYSSIPSEGAIPTHERNQELFTFAHRALKLYQRSLKESPSCPEAALLAALAILHLNIRKPNQQRVFIAMNILEIAREESPDYYIMTVLLILLRAHLGLLSWAMVNFTKLSVKNMQWETVGHLILTRISTLYPAFRGEVGDLDPLLAAGSSVNVLENADKTLVRGIREGLRFNSYSNIYNSVKMRSDIERSLNKQICAIEERRISRWQSPVSDDHTVLTPMDPSKTLVDKRDYSYLPSYRIDDRAMLKLHCCGEQPKEGWVNAMVLRDNVATYLKQDLASHAAPATAAYGNLERLYERFSDGTFNESQLKNEMTGVERSILDTARSITCAIFLVNQGQTTILNYGEYQSLAYFLASIKSSLKAHLHGCRLHDDLRRKSGLSQHQPKIAGVYIPWWEDLHISFSKLDELQVISSFLTWISRKLQKSGKINKAVFGTVSRETITELQNLVIENEAQIHANARWMKDQINEPGVLGQLVDLSMARQVEPDPETDAAGNGQSIWKELKAGAEWEEMMESLCSEASMESICGTYRESWDDALDGILSTKVRVAK